MNKKTSNWRTARLPASRHQPSHQSIEARLRQRHALWLHAWAMGACTLAVVALVAWLLRHFAGVDALAVRYAVSLAVGYGVYLLLLRWWAERLLRQRQEDDIDPLDALDALDYVPSPGGGGTSEAAGELAGNALDLAAGADEAAVVLIPVVVIFAVGVALLSGLGAAALLFFGTDALLAVAVELAFAYTAARTAMAAENAGWLPAAIRLTWKPMLGTLLCAVALGAAIDHWVPSVETWPQALRWLRAALI